MAFDIDYRSKITRADFESACRDLKGRFVSPIYDALDFAGLTMVCPSGSFESRDKLISARTISPVLF